MYNTAGHAPLNSTAFGSERVDARSLFSYIYQFNFWQNPNNMVLNENGYESALVKEIHDHRQQEENFIFYPSYGNISFFLPKITSQ